MKRCRRARLTFKSSVDPRLPVIKEILYSSGYKVLETKQGGEALAIIRRQAEDIQLVLTDVVMTGASAPELTREITDLVPGGCIMFMSGYTDDEIARHGVLEEGKAFLRKPFTPD